MPSVLLLTGEDHTNYQPSCFRRQRSGRSRFRPWRKNAGIRVMPPRCLRNLAAAQKLIHILSRSQRIVPLAEGIVPC